MIKNKFYNEDLNLITDKTERFVVFMNDFKNGMGAWYSIFALRVLPVLLYIIPVNVVLGRMTLYYNRYIDPAFFWNGPVLMIIWVLSIVLLLVLVIIAPKAASVFEFFFGFGYLFFAFRHHLFNKSCFSLWSGLSEKSSSRAMPPRELSAMNPDAWYNHPRRTYSSQRRRRLRTMTRLSPRATETFCLTKQRTAPKSLMMSLR